jgi:hypothetical protein
MMNDQLAFSKLAIQEMAARYSESLIRRDWNTFHSCWTWGGVYRVQGLTSMEKKGLDAIAAAMKAHLEGLEGFFHTTQPGVIEVFGREAKARFPFIEARRAQGEETRTTLYGHYEDEWRLGMTGLWQLEKRTCTILSRDEVFDPRSIQVGA